jgi:hypothetical protein
MRGLGLAEQHAVADAVGKQVEWHGGVQEVRSRLRVGSNSPGGAMKHLVMIAMVGTLAILQGCGSAENICTTKAQEFSTALAQAGQCTPAAVTPCVAYGVAGLAGGGCYAGVAPSSVAALDALVSDYLAAGCPRTAYPCPSPPAYTCQAGAGGASQCM